MWCCRLFFPTLWGGGRKVGTSYSSMLMVPPAQTAICMCPVAVDNKNGTAAGARQCHVFVRRALQPRHRQQRCANPFLCCWSRPKSSRISKSRTLTVT